MNYSCGVIRDLLLLQQENLCSEESKKIINEHIKECEQCQNYLNSLKNDFELSNKEKVNEEMKKAQSIKKIKNKLRKKTVLTVCISIFSCLLICTIPIFFMKDTIVDTFGLKREITDINNYEECFGDDLSSVYFDKLGMDDSIFPEKITSDMGVEEFEFVFEISLIFILLT
jgi:hypothetical protein